MNGERIKKLENTTKLLLSSFIFEEMENSQEEFGIITVTGVKISSDLSYLDVYVSCFKNKELLPKGIARHGYDIQKRLNKSIGIRKLPKIRFRYDNNGEITQEMLDIINKEIKINK